MHRLYVMLDNKLSPYLNNGLRVNCYELTPHGSHVTIELMTIEHATKLIGRKLRQFGHICRIHVAQ